MYAGLNGWNWWQRDQSAKAAAMFDELELAAQAGDAQRAGQIFADLKERYPRTVFAEQGGLLAARVQFDRGQADAAKASLTWVADNASEDEYKTVARLRLAGLLLQAKDYDDALKQLDARQGADLRGPGGRPPRRRAAGPGQDGRGAQRLPGGVEGDGREGRVPAPDRRQAHRAGRAAGGRLGSRRGQATEAGK